jgi:hypothetical protein
VRLAFSFNESPQLTSLALPAVGAIYEGTSNIQLVTIGKLLTKEYS